MGKKKRSGGKNRKSVSKENYFINHRGYESRETDDPFI